MWGKKYDLVKAAIEGTLDKIPKGYFTKEALLYTKGGKRPGWNVFHYAARGGTLLQIPREFLTKENLTIATTEGNNSFLLAAWHGNLTREKFPEELITEKNLRHIFHTTEVSGGSCFHAAVSGGNVKNLPKKFLTLENLILLKDGVGETPLGKTLLFGNIDKFPKKLLTLENLLKKPTGKRLKGMCHLVRVLREGGSGERYITLNLKPQKEDTKHLNELKLVLAELKKESGGNSIDFIDSFIKEVECFKRMKEMPSLRL